MEQETPEGPSLPYQLNGSHSPYSTSQILLLVYSRVSLSQNLVSTYISRALDLLNFVFSYIIL